MLKKLFWRGLTLIFLGIAVIGAILPGLPTTEFLLLALWSSSHGWAAVHRWLLNHQKYGPLLSQWKNHRIMPRRAKLICVLTMGISTYLLLSSAMPLWLKVSLVALMMLVLIWLISRPEHLQHDSQHS